jgi:putative endonuclease
MLYVGMTNNLNRRVLEHKQKLIKGYTEKYNLDKLVYYQEFSRIEDAIAAEKQIKGWVRTKKNNLIILSNPTWKDLS